MAFCLLCVLAFGQVKNQAYKAMLHGLLTHDVPEISVAKASQAQQQYLFLDAREPREYEVSHIEGAAPVGYNQFNISQLGSIPKDKPIIIYCSVGYRSEKITEQLAKAGYFNVSNLYGGIFEWVNQGHPVVDQNGPTRNVHAYDKSWGVWLSKGRKVYR